MLNERKLIASKASRLEKRQSLGIIDGIGRETVKELIGDFVFTPEHEQLADRYAWDQLMLLTDIAHSNDDSKLRLYGQLMENKNVLGEAPDMNEVMQLVDKSGSEYALRCYYQGRLIKEANYKFEDHKLTSSSDFFYFNRTDGGEGVLEVCYNSLTPDDKTEIIYTHPVDGRNFGNHIDRESLSAFVLTGNTDDQELSVRTTTSDDRFMVEESVIFHNRLPVAKNATYREVNNPNDIYSFHLSFAKDLPPSLVVEHYIAYGKKNRYWVFVPDPTRKLDYEYLLEDLADGYTPDQDQSLDFIFSLTVDDKNDTVVANFDGEDLIGFQPTRPNLIPEELIDSDEVGLPWVFRTSNNQKSLVVCLSDNGIEEYFFELGQIAENDQSN